MNTLLLNPHLTSPCGFEPDARGRNAVPVPAGSVWGRADVERLRPAARVVVTAPRQGTAPVPGGWGAPSRRADDAGTSGAPALPGRALTEDRLRALTVHLLALAGVPTTTTDLPEAVRTLLDRDLLRVADTLDADVADDRGRREQVSLELRRTAWLAGPGRWYHPSPPVVLVQLPEDPDATLLSDLEAQEGVVVRTSPAGAPGEEAGADYRASVAAGLRYGPHHLQDLVTGLLQARAAVAHSPDRFRRHPDGAWLEQADVADRPAPGGLPGGSLWRAGDGPAPPPGPGHAVHGAGAVRADVGPEDRTGVLRRHAGRPVLLGWLGGDDRPAPAPAPSYPARKPAGVPVRDRTSATAADS